ncbi:YiaA/YiaB family inner membrane protein [Rubellimicrobium roseum]|uniref:YiaAB two helix domain-containing protein n=1 Tax=Rubellimicrobium roseum TaxID=687525 RepID=A0A5C4NHN4_9RHOB|nr:YiaA/YiaB family inner membrane protein [Rubellimicrobium roseum]TNC72187.1 hypothetical protein FHG71_09035 [Rubellimicrobium roseum]
MSTPTRSDSSAWRTFTFVNFAVAALMMAGGIWFLDASFAVKGFYAMAALMLVSSTVSLSKTLRDEAEAERDRERRREEADARLPGGMAHPS